MNIIPGRIHTHNGKRVYHRADGGLKFHGRRHSEYSPARDRAHHTKKHPGKAGYPHTGDGKPKHRGEDRPLKSRMKTKGKR